MTDLFGGAARVFTAPSTLLPGVAVGDFSLRRLISDVLHVLRFMVLAFAVLWALFLRPTALGGSTTYVRVHGGSMVPTIMGGDLAIVRQEDSYRVGEVVAFEADEGMVIHRIIGGSAEEGYQTQGDARDTADAWNPGPELIAGRLWFSIPYAGVLGDQLQKPRVFGAFAGFLALFVLSGFLHVPRRRRRERATHGVVPPGRGRLPRRVVLLAALAIASIELAACLVFATRRETQSTAYTNVRAYGHHAGFTYTAQMTPSSLYPEGTLGPVSPGETPSQPVPLFTRLTKSLDLVLVYAFDGADAAPVDLEYGLALRIAGGKDGWVQETQLVAPQAVAGPRLQVPISLDLAEIGDLLTAVETETGFKPDAYTISIVPTIRARATSNGVPVDDVFSPAFPIRYTPTMLTLEDTSIRTADRTRSVSSITFHNYVLGPLHLTAGEVRSALAVALGLTLAATLITGAFAAGPLFTDESRRIAARYGTLLVEVANVDPLPARSIRVVSMEDLARVAQRESLAICHVAPRGLYFVQSTSARFEYILRSRRKAGPVTPLHGSPDGLARSA